MKQDSDIGGDSSSFDMHGNYIELEHAQGEYSIYEHLRKESVAVTIGEHVKRWQLIGYSGKTGWMGGLGSHVHFDVHQYVGEGSEEYDSLEIVWNI